MPSLTCLAVNFVVLQKDKEYPGDHPSVEHMNQMAEWTKRGLRTFVEGTKQESGE